MLKGQEAHQGLANAGKVIQVNIYEQTLSIHQAYCERGMVQVCTASRATHQ